MAASSIKTHIPEDASPDKLLPLIVGMHDEDISFPSLTSLREFTKEHGLGQRSELAWFAKLCNFLQQDGDGHIQLTEDGHILARIKPELRADIVHFRIYTIHDPLNPQVSTESWAYQRVVDSMWHRSPINVLSIKDAVVEEINNAALELFEASISFSPKSIRGVRKWLEVLSPPVMENNLLSRRSFCHPELMLLAIGCLMQRDNAELGIDLLLTQARREAICRLCVLEPAALDRTLDWMMPVYSHIVVPGTTAGTYGRFLRFLKWPTMSDLLPGAG